VTRMHGNVEVFTPSYSLTLACKRVIELQSQGLEYENSHPERNSESWSPIISIE
jgi:hypothetical protein